MLFPNSDCPDASIHLQHHHHHLQPQQSQPQLQQFPTPSPLPQLSYQYEYQQQQQQQPIYYGHQQQQSQIPSLSSPPHSPSSSMSLSSSASSIPKGGGGAAKNLPLAIRIDYSQVTEQDIDNIVIKRGEPLVITNVTKGWDTSYFNLKWLKDRYSNIEISVRVNGGSEKHWSLGHYIDYIASLPINGNPNYISLVNQFKSQNNQNDHYNNNINSTGNGNGSPFKQSNSPSSSSSPSSLFSTSSPSSSTSPSTSYSPQPQHHNQPTQLIQPQPQLCSLPCNPVHYKKDVPCPPEWKSLIMEEGRLPDFIKERGTGDLVSELPPNKMPNTTHLNIDYHNYFSPAKREVSGSLGFNLMVSSDLNTATTFWFCTTTPSHQDVSKYWHDKLNGSLFDNESKQFIISPKDFSNAPFEVYTFEQKVGDLVILPSCAVSQYLSVGGTSIKVSWNRMTIDSLFNGYKYLLPVYRPIKRRDVFCLKNIAYNSLKMRIKTIESFVNGGGNLMNTLHMTDDLITLHKLVSEIYWSETIDLSISFNERKSNDINVKLVQPNNNMLDCSSNNNIRSSSTTSSSSSSILCVENDGIHRRTCFGCNSFIFNRFYTCHDCYSNHYSNNINSNNNHNNGNGQTPPSTPSPNNQLHHNDMDNNPNYFDFCLNCIAEATICKHAKKIQLCEYFDGNEVKELLGLSRQILYNMLSIHPSHRDTVDLVFKNFSHDTMVSCATIAYNQVMLTIEDDKATCHQCKLARPRSRIAYCTREHDGHSSAQTGPPKKKKKAAKACQKKYCQQCLMNRYNINLIDCLKEKKWDCMFCRDLCDCSACIKRKKDKGMTVPLTKYRSPPSSRCTSPPPSTSTSTGTLTTALVSTHLYSPQAQMTSSFIPDPMPYPSPRESLANGPPPLKFGPLSHIPNDGNTLLSPLHYLKMSPHSISSSSPLLLPPSPSPSTSIPGAPASTFENSSILLKLKANPFSNTALIPSPTTSNIPPPPPFFNHPHTTTGSSGRKPPLPTTGSFSEYSSPSSTSSSTSSYYFPGKPITYPILPDRRALLDMPHSISTSYDSFLPVNNNCTYPLPTDPFPSITATGSNNDGGVLTSSSSTTVVDDKLGKRGSMKKRRCDSEPVLSVPKRDTMMHHPYSSPPCYMDASSTSASTSSSSSSLHHSSGTIDNTYYPHHHHHHHHNHHGSISNNNNGTMVSLQPSSSPSPSPSLFNNKSTPTIQIYNGDQLIEGRLANIDDIPASNHNGDKSHDYSFVYTRGNDKAQWIDNNQIVVNHNHQHIQPHHNQQQLNHQQQQQQQQYDLHQSNQNWEEKSRLLVSTMMGPNNNNNNNNNNDNSPTPSTTSTPSQQQQQLPYHQDVSNQTNYQNNDHHHHHSYVYYNDQNTTNTHPPALLTTSTITTDNHDQLISHYPNLNHHHQQLLPDHNNHHPHHNPHSSQWSITAWDPVTTTKDSVIEVSNSHNYNWISPNTSSYHQNHHSSSPSPSPDISTNTTALHNHGSFDCQTDSL